jgi:hypothetical protein
MSSPQDFRLQVLEQLRKNGSDTSRPHTFDFYLYLPTETAAQEAAKRLIKRNYLVDVRPAAKGPDWLCLANSTLIPETAPLTEIGQFFTQLADEFHGEFDGWEAEVIKE